MPLSAIVPGSNRISKPKLAPYCTSFYLYWPINISRFKYIIIFITVSKIAYMIRNDLKRSFRCLSAYSPFPTSPNNILSIHST